MALGLVDADVGEVDGSEFVEAGDGAGDGAAGLGTGAVLPQAAAPNETATAPANATRRVGMVCMVVPLKRWCEQVNDAATTRRRPLATE